MPQQLPNPWEHEHGYRVNNDGCQIRYRHPTNHIEITVEGILSDDESELHYIVWVFDDEKNSLEHPTIRVQKDSAFDKAREYAEQYA